MIAKNKNVGKKLEGVVLLEVLLSVFVLVTVFFAVSMIANSSVSVNGLMRNYVVGNGLLIEGIESVKTLRDTNRLREPLISSCWMRRDPDGDCADVLGVGKNYVFAPDTSGLVVMTEVAAADLDGEKEQMDEAYRLYKDVQNYGLTTSKKTLDPTIFYRAIKSEVINDDTAVFTVKLQWNEGVKVRTLVESIVLKNYY